MHLIDSLRLFLTSCNIKAVFTKLKKICETLHICNLTLLTEGFNFNSLVPRASQPQGLVIDPSSAMEEDSNINSPGVPSKDAVLSQPSLAPISV